MFFFWLVLSKLFVPTWFPTPTSINSCLLISFILYKVYRWCALITQQLYLPLKGIINSYKKFPAYTALTMFSKEKQLSLEIVKAIVALNEVRNKKYKDDIEKKWCLVVLLLNKASPSLNDVIHEFCLLLRYLAVTRPVEYHINVTASGSSPWKRVMKYMIPTVLFR